MTKNEISDATVIDLARIITDLNRDVADLRQSIDAQVRTHPLYREQVRRTQDVQRHAADQRAEIARLRAEREERTGPVAEEPTDLGAVIVATAQVPGQEAKRRMLTRATRGNVPAWISSTGGNYDWCHFTAPRWATATERATGKVDPEQDEPGKGCSCDDCDQRHGDRCETCDERAASCVCPPDRLEWLKGEDAYAAAPLGTIASNDTTTINETITKTPTGWITTDGEHRPWPYLARTVTRWGFGPDWEPGADVTDRIDQAPEGAIVQDRDGDYWHSNADGWFFWLGADTGWGTAPASLTTFVDLAPIIVATAEQIAAAGITQEEN